MLPVFALLLGWALPTLARHLARQAEPAVPGLLISASMDGSGAEQLAEQLPEQLAEEPWADFDLAAQCGLPREAGPGPLRLDRFFFNQTARACAQFVFSGAGGNANNFRDLHSCQVTCEDRPPVQPELQLEIQPVQPDAEPDCAAPAAPGNCSGQSGDTVGWIRDRGYCRPEKGSGCSWGPG